MFKFVDAKKMSKMFWLALYFAEEKLLYVTTCGMKVVKIAFTATVVKKIL